MSGDDEDTHARLLAAASQDGAFTLEVKTFPRRANPVERSRVVVVPHESDPDGAVAELRLESRTRGVEDVLIVGLNLEETAMVIIALSRCLPPERRMSLSRRRGRE